MFTPAEHFFTPEQLATAERLAGDLTLAPYPMPNPLGTPEVLRKQYLARVEQSAAAYARAIDLQRPKHIIDAAWQIHQGSIDTYQRLYGRKPEHVGGVWV